MVGSQKDIWVLLKPSNNKYYPQSDHTNTSYKRDGEWQVITRFGGDKGESYDFYFKIQQSFERKKDDC